MRRLVLHPISELIAFMCCACALSGCGTACSQDRIGEHLRDLSSQDAAVRMHAVVCLGDYGPKAESAVAHIVSMIDKENDDEVKCAAIWALGKIGKSVNEHIPEILSVYRKSDNRDIRLQVLSTIHLIAPDSTSVLEFIREAERDRDLSVRRYAEELMNSSGK